MSSLLPTRAQLRALPLDAFVDIDVETGMDVRGEAHLAQSVRDILLTPVGSEVMDRTYGAGLFERIDSPLTAGAGAQLVADSAEALMAWEPRVDPARVVTRTEKGRLGLDLELTRPAGSPDRGAAIQLEGVL